VPEFIYLASQSPRRRQLLEQLGVAYQMLLPGTDEDAEQLEQVQPGEAPRRYVLRVTGLKLDAALARLAQRRLPAGAVLCADTTVALGRTILGKPDDQEHARAMLQALQGQTHRVLTAVAIQSGQLRQAKVVESRVRFARMTSAQIGAYVATGEPMGKAGAYAVQGRAAAFVAHISGSYSGIMGLPAYETAHMLRAIGL
jgi:septum formation protein